VDAWYHHWLARTLDPVEARCAQIGTGDFLFDEPSLFEVVLLPQLFNARKLAFDLAPYPHLTRIEAACLALPEFQRAYPDNQPDSPDYKG
ncbi:MAG: maleylacetoacetate isomerase, partial [Pseudomonadota bacterium]